MPTDAHKRTSKARAVLQLWRRWRKRIARPGVSGPRVISAIRPVFTDWLNRRHGGFSYRVTQVLTGHGFFGSYLCRIGKEETPRCWHCPERVDTAEHTLEVCSAWDDTRQVLKTQLGLGDNDLSHSSVVSRRYHQCLPVEEEG